MQTIVKIPKELFDQARSDLLRPHRFAYERVGFFSTRCSTMNGTILVHCISYHPVGDDDYIEDRSVGVRIGPNAITEAMSRALKDSVGQIHVHWHGGTGLSGPSPTDTRELPPLTKSLRNAFASGAHGWMILSQDDAWTSLLLPSHTQPLDESPVSIVGFPTTVKRRTLRLEDRSRGPLVRWLFRKRKGVDRYDRQSFLGPDSDRTIQQAVIGVVGLGGGGSHVVQQLAHLGFRNFVLCDHDRISLSNLNRLVGATRADVTAKRLKVDIASRTIRKLHKDAHILSHSSKWEDAVDDLSACDVILGCLDGFGARRDIEAFCRRHLIPYLDVGMDVQELSPGRYEVYGQVILSMPGKPCMHCMGFLNDSILGEEAQKYGAAGNKPQVVWSNGLLCSADVGIAVDLLTDWSKTLRHPVFLSFRGSELSLTSDKRLPALRTACCPHYPLTQAGDPVLSPL